MIVGRFPQGENSVLSTVWSEVSRNMTTMEYIIPADIVSRAKVVVFSKGKRNVLLVSALLQSDVTISTEWGKEEVDGYLLSYSYSLIIGPGENESTIRIAVTGSTPSWVTGIDQFSFKISLLSN